MFFPRLSITIPENLVYRYMGFLKENKVPEDWKYRIKEAIKQARVYLKPTGMMKTEEICSELLDKWEWNTLKFGGKQVKRVINRGYKITFLIATIGGDLEKQVESYTKHQDLTSAYLWDSIGTVAVHQTVEQLKKYIKPMAQREGAQLSPRMAPGYGDWMIEAQSLFFKYLDFNRVGVTFNDDYLIIPKHSLTGIIVWTHQNVTPNEPCQTCAKFDCIYRKTPVKVS
ncbi:hypothetical protein [Tepidibacillus fermentans]|uniref:Cobalamin-dependent methionine synthase-like protein n=1 Tax=Tepidibacillus fermentans TaxID=1281767 RepID=A0A4R3KG17_9BACI|nr:hypothetical protein [Tepidibacillus fermentans]TCS82105.1 hypothetical protein EDD72_11039 [Tepidibacillus fermentans]